MAVRKDSVQIDITFITDENRQLAKLNQSNKTLISDLNKAKKEGGDVAAVFSRIAAQGKTVEQLDLSRIAPAELIARAKTLATVLRQIPDSAPEAAKLQAEYKLINTRLAEIRASTRGVIQESSKLKGVLGTALGVFGGISFAGIASGILQIGKNLISTSSNFQKFEAVLTNTLGSKSEAQKALKQLQDFAATTPFSLEELTASYIKLVNRGIKPTQADLVALGDIAASQGKTFDQLTEAILDATTGEFERLKEFGIRAKKEGDTVALTFKGVTKEVKNNEAAIKDAILQFGQFEGVLGSTAAQAATRAGIISNLGDSISRLFNNLGSGAIGRVFDSVLGGVSKLIGGLVKLTDQQESASKSTKQLQAEFNIEIETLKRGEITQETRSRLIDSINTKYKEYLPNLIKESDTIDQITIAQNAANDSFRQRIILLAAEEQLVDIQRQLLAAKRAELDLALELEERLAADEQRGIARDNRRAQARRGTSGAERANLDDNIKLQAELQAEMDKTSEAAAALGLDIAKILGGEPVTTTTNSSAPYDPEKALQTRLKGITAAFTREQVLLERALLQKEITESDYGKRVLELQKAQYEQQIAAYELYNQSTVVEAEQARNKLIEIQQQLTRNPGNAVQALPTAQPGQVQRRGINAGLDQLAQNEEDQLTRLRRAFESALLAENDYSVAKLELRRYTLEQEIELLRTGTEAEVRLAYEKSQQLIQVDRDLAAERKRIAQNEADLKKQIYQATGQFFKDSIDFGIQLLSQDDAARKKNIGIIKQFQRGQIIASGIAEVQKIWEKSADLGVGPLRSILAAVQTLAAVARTSTALSKINSTKFTAAKGITLGEFGGNLHSAGGTEGVFSDGTRIEVERGEKFVVLNRKASGLLGNLSSLNMATGGRSLLSASNTLRYMGGGAVPTSPTFDRSILQGNAGVDLEPMLNEFKLLRMAFETFPTNLRAYVPFTDLEDTAADVNAVRSASSV